MKNRFFYFAAFSAISAILGASNYASATTWYTGFAGIECHSNAYDCITYNSGLACNTCDSAVYFDCPVSQTTGSSDTVDIDGRVYVLDANSSAQVRCRLRCTDPSTLTYYYSDFEYSDDGIDILYFDTITCDESWAASVVCLVPAESTEPSCVSGYVTYISD